MALVKTFRGASVSVTPLAAMLTKNRGARESGEPIGKVYDSTTQVRS
jgi:hypothetical protein